MARRDEGAFCRDVTEPQRSQLGRDASAAIDFAVRGHSGVCNRERKSPLSSGHERAVGDRHSPSEHSSHPAVVERACVKSPTRGGFRTKPRDRVRGTSCTKRRRSPAASAIEIVSCPKPGTGRGRRARSGGLMSRERGLKGAASSARVWRDAVNRPRQPSTNAIAAP